MCFGKKEHNQPPVRVHEVEEDVNTIYRVQQTCNLADPPQLTLKVDVHPVKFELDSGASSTPVHESAIRRFPKLHPTQVGFISATGHKMQVRGLFIAQIEHNGEVYQLPVHVFKGEPRTNPLGRNWINCMPTLLAHIHNLRETLGLKNLLQKHASVFGDDNHAISDGPTAKFESKSVCHPNVFKARPVPYAMAPKVEEELDRLIKADVIGPVAYSD